MDSESDLAHEAGNWYPAMTKRAWGLAGFLLCLVLVKACQMGGWL